MCSNHQLVLAILTGGAIATHSFAERQTTFDTKFTLSVTEDDGSAQVVKNSHLTAGINLLLLEAPDGGNGDLAYLNGTNGAAQLLFPLGSTPPYEARLPVLTGTETLQPLTTSPGQGDAVFGTSDALLTTQDFGTEFWACPELVYGQQVTELRYGPGPDSNCKVIVVHANYVP